MLLAFLLHLNFQIYTWARRVRMTRNKNHGAKSTHFLLSFEAIIPYLQSTYQIALVNIEIISIHQLLFQAQPIKQYHMLRFDDGKHPAQGRRNKKGPELS